MIMHSSLYAQYIKERLDKNIVESEKGFCTWSYFLEGIYLEDVYVNPDFRKEGIATQMTDEIAEIAKSKGMKRIYGSVVPSANGSKASLRVLLAYGFELDSCTQNFILLSKEI